MGRAYSGFLDAARQAAKRTSQTAVLTLWLVSAAEAAPPAPAADAAQLPEIRRYCASIAAAASEARFAWQTGKLNELEGRIKTRIAELDAKQAELRAMIEKRESIEKKANEKLVGIYAKMRPETAATQLSTLDDDMAAAVIGQLNARQASSIFNEIAPERAAKLAGLIANVSPGEKKP